MVSRNIEGKIDRCWQFILLKMELLRNDNEFFSKWTFHISNFPLIFKDTFIIHIQVETYGSMEKNEKVDFILEQMRLCLAKADYIRTQIISKKISSRFFDEEGTEEYKLRFYKLMIQVDLHEESYLAVCKHYKAIYDTKTILDDPTKMKEVLR